MKRILESIARIEGERQSRIDRLDAERYRKLKAFHKLDEDFDASVDALPNPPTTTATSSPDELPETNHTPSALND